MTPSTSRIPTAGRALLSWIFVALAAVLALAVVQLAFEINALRDENAALRSGRELAEVAARAAEVRLKERTLVAEGMINELGRQLREKNDLSHFKSFSLLPPVADKNGPVALAVWDVAQQTGKIAIALLPASTSEQEYRWWFIDSAGHRSTGGSFQSDGSGTVILTIHPATPVSNLVGISVTLEKKGDALSPTGPTILEGTFKE